MLCRGLNRRKNMNENDIGELFILQERYVDSYGTNHPPGSFAFYLGKGKLNFIETNSTVYYSSWTNYLKKVEVSDKLSGLSFCFTGALDHPRDYYKKLVELNGGKIASGITKSLSYLVVSDSFLLNEKYGQPSTKLQKARSIGVNVIGFKQFIGMVK